MNKKRRTGILAEILIGKLKFQNINKAKADQIIQEIVDLFERLSGAKVVNKKELKIKLEDPK